MDAYSHLLLDSLDKRHTDVILSEIARGGERARVWLLGVHERANIGDLALTYAAETLLAEVYPDRELVTMSRSMVTYNWQKIVPRVGAGDIIVLPGGGNLGDIWPHEEAFRQLVIRTFVGNRIISLPQSVHFANEASARTAGRCYDAHPDLLMFVRDAQSYHRLTALTSTTDVRLAVDTAFAYEYPVAFLPQDRSLALIIRRADKEGVHGPTIDALASSLAESGLIANHTDTVYDDLEFVGSAFGAKSVYRKIDQCHAAGVVITDRLHGAIFGLLAGRPVVAFDNSYRKISGGLEPLRERLGDRLVIVDGEVPDSATITSMAAMEDAAESPAEMLTAQLTQLREALSVASAAI